MGHTRQRNTLADEQVPGEQALMTLVPMKFAPGLSLHEFFQLRNETAVGLLVVRRVTQDNAAIGVERNAICQLG
jgi:hypothetical protein